MCVCVLYLFSLLLYWVPASEGWWRAWRSFLLVVKNKVGRPSDELGGAIPRGMRYFFNSVLWQCWLGDRNGIRPVKTRVLLCRCWRLDWTFACPIAPVVATICIVPIVPTKSRTETFWYIAGLWKTSVVVVTYFFSAVNCLLLEYCVVMRCWLATLPPSNTIGAISGQRQMLELLAGRQEGHNYGLEINWVLVCWWCRFDWSFARLIAPTVHHPLLGLITYVQLI